MHQMVLKNALGLFNTLMDLPQGQVDLGLIKNAKCYIMGEQRASQLSLSRRTSSLVSMPSAPSH